MSPASNRGSWASIGSAAGSLTGNASAGGAASCGRVKRQTPKQETETNPKDLRSKKREELSERRDPLWVRNVETHSRNAYLYFVVFPGSDFLGAVMV